MIKIKYILLIMCLIKLRKFPKISFKPIKVYKVFYEQENGYYTPYVFTGPLKTGDTIKAKCNIFGGFYRIFFGECIDTEGVHAFTSKIFAEAKFRNFSKTAILECIIPRFTLYWYGSEGEIAARKIKIL